MNTMFSVHYDTLMLEVFKEKHSNFKTIIEQKTQRAAAQALDSKEFISHMHLVYLGLFSLAKSPINAIQESKR